MKNKYKMEEYILSKLKEVLQKKHKKIIALLIVVVLIVAGISGVNVLSANKMKKQQVASVETETIEKRTLTNSISATGTIVAGETQEEQTSLTSYEITAVNVKVGDRVKAGDILCTFDVSNIEDSLDTIQKSIETGEKQNDVSEQAAKRSLGYAQETKNAQSAQADSNVETAESKLTDAQNNQSDIESDLDSANDKVSSTKKTYNSKKKSYEGLKGDYDTNNTAYETANVASQAAQALVDDLTSQIAANSDESVLIELNNKLTAAKEDLATKLQATSDAKAQLAAIEASYNEAKAAYEAASSSYETAKANQSTLEAQLDSARVTVESAQTTYDNSIYERDNTNRSNNNTVQSQQENLTSTKLTNETNQDSKKDELKKYEEQLEKGNVTAKIDGVVTTVNVSAGNIYTGGDMVIIENDSSFIVEATVDEYDIGDLYTGMPVIIKTNATGEEELSGTITYISPKPESQTTTTSTSSDVTYKVEVSVDTANDKIRLGMTAKLSIILETKDNVFAVPYDAVTETQDGQGTIQVVINDNEPPKEVNVTLGLDTDYYIEISSDEITEGMRVVIPSTNTDASPFTNMGPMGGF